MQHLPYLNITPVALLLGVLTHMLIGMLWYGPYLFGPLWMSFSKVKASTFKMTWMHWAGSASSGLTITLVLNALLRMMHVTTCLASVKLALLFWLGFIVTTNLSPVLWEKKPYQLYLLSIAHWAVALALIACVTTKL